MNERNQLEEIGGLKALRWGADAPSAKKIVVLHGYGASAFDLFDLGQVLDPKGEYQWFFPQGPLQLNMGMMLAGYAWFPIDVEAAERAIQESGGLKYAHLRPPGVDEAVERSLKFLKAIGFDPARDSLGGFSQGSMMCIELQRKLPIPVSQLLLFSGSLVDETGLSTHSQQFEGLKVFQSHGRFDEVLPLAGAEALRESLSHLGCQVEFREFSGGHEIPMSILQNCRQFLKS